jgi:hypothetical protein
MPQHINILDICYIYCAANIPKMTIYRHHERDLADRLSTALRQMPCVAGVRRKSGKPADLGADIVVNASINRKPVHLMVHIEDKVFPRDVRAAFWDLRSVSRRPGKAAGSVRVIPMIAAATISDGAKELLREEGIGYFESGGSLFLVHDSLYVFIDRPAIKAARKIDRPLFSGNRSQVIHALLMNPEQWFSTRELAALSHVSPSTASIVLGELEKRDLAIVQGKGPGKTRRLNQPGALLDGWVKQRSLLPKPEMRRYYVPLVKAEDLMKRLRKVCAAHQTACVITHEWAAQLYSPFLSNISQVKCRIFPNAPLSLMAQELKAREVEEGSNWAVIESESMRDMLFQQDIRGLPVESPILAYLDLINGEGRAPEMAEHLRREKIRF